eukprot:7436819-Karenia_brevis.AAC.1
MVLCDMSHNEEDYGYDEVDHMGYLHWDTFPFDNWWTLGPRAQNLEHRHKPVMMQTTQMT